MLRYAVWLALVLVSGVAIRGSPSEKRNVPGSDNTPDTNCTEKEECENSPLEISFIVDASSSIGDANFGNCLNFIEDFAEHFTISADKVRMSLVTFAKKADENNAFGFTNYTDLESLKSAIANTTFTKYQWTNTSAGIWYMLEHHAPEVRANVSHVVIVITDGRSQETSKTKAASADLHKLGGNVTIIVVGVGRDVYYSELSTIAGEGNNVFEVESYELLETLLERLVVKTCNKRVLPACKMDPVELAFVIDSSASIGRANFDTSINFVKSFVSRFKVDQQHVRVAAVTFDFQANHDQAIAFNDYAERPGLLRKLKEISYTAGNRTNIGAGIKYMTEVLMLRARPSAARICIVLTGGNPTDPQASQKMANQTRSKFGITMYAIGVGNVHEHELVNIAGSDRRIFSVTNYRNLNNKKSELLTRTCETANRYFAKQGELEKSRYR